MLLNLALTQLFLFHHVCVYALIPPRQLLGLIPESDMDTSPIPLAPSTSITKEQHPSLTTIELHTTPLIVSLLSSLTEKAFDTHRTETHTQSITSPSPSIISESSTSMLASSTSSSSSTKYNTILPTTHIGTPTHHDDVHPSPSPTPQDGSTMSRGQVVGITALCFVIAIVITMLLGFFDTWWGFLKGVVTGKRKGDDSDLSEDWEAKRTISWLGGGEDTYSGAEKGSGLPALPSPTYSGHPLDPLFRRPSTRPMPPPFEPQPY
ncbi:hypothetical protein CPB85DRAFT_1427295 [Mucidula mucida]|nr:hypothetical protein CPB85DRAFT_1427295 [Mucidula mucida]